MTTRQYGHLYASMEKVNHYVCVLKPSIREEMPQEMRRIPLNVRSNLIGIKVLQLQKDSSQRALIQYTQPQKWMNTKSVKKR